MPNKNSAMISKNTYLFILLLLVIFSLIQTRVITRMPVTGDEPSYMLMGLSFYEDRDLDIRNNFDNGGHKKIGLGSIDSVDVFHHTGMYPGHSGTISIIASPFIGKWGVKGGRYVTTAFALITALLLYSFFHNIYHAKLSHIFAILFIGLFTSPYISYASMLYSEVIASFFILLGFYLLNRNMSRMNAVALITTICLYPFIHIRLVPVAISLFLLYLWRTWRDRSSVSLRIIIPAAILLIALATFYSVQTQVYGSLTGGAGANLNIFSQIINPKYLYDYFGVQLFSIRHGFLAYAPVWIFAFIAIVDGCLRKDKYSCQILFLIVPYIVLFTVMDGGECAPGRFWAPIMPLLMISLYPLISSHNKRWIYLLGAPLLALSLYNSSIYFKDPDIYLSNIGYSKLYTGYIYNHLGGWLDLGMILPVDFENTSFNLGHRLLLFTSIIIILQVVAVQNKQSKLLLNLCGLSSILISILILSSAVVLPISHKNYTVTSNYPGDSRLLQDNDKGTRWTTGVTRKKGDYLQIDFQKPTFIRAIHFIGPLSDLPRDYLIELSYDGNNYFDASHNVINGRLYLYFPENKKLKGIRITNLDNENSFWWSIHELRLEKTFI